MPQHTQIHCHSKTDQRNGQKQRKKAKLAYKRKVALEKSRVCHRRILPDLTQRLIDCGCHGQYLAWQEAYLRWRRGQAHGAKGEPLQHIEQERKKTRLSVKKSCATGKAQVCHKRPLPDLTHILIDAGLHDQYLAWHKGYLRWRTGQARGAQGDLSPRALKRFESMLEQCCQVQDALQDALQEYRGALQEAQTRVLQTVQQPIAHDACGLSQTVFDVASDTQGELMLVPVDGPPGAGMRLEELAQDALVSVRVFRFFEHCADEKQVWERELRNVNSGSLTWLPTHLAPGLHSRQGAKYGKWFTIHTVQVYAKHFKSAYHMCEEGCNILAKSFGCTQAQKWTIDHVPLETGYFWFVSPVSADGSSTSEDGHLNACGWRHLSSEGPFHGEAFLKEWQKRGSRMATHDLQAMLRQMTCHSSNKQ